MWLRAIVRYDGTNYEGFQAQPNGRAIQNILTMRFRRLLGPGVVLGASRTDSGVHARGQVIVWTGACLIPVDRVMRALNGNLPPDIQIIAVDWVEDGWDPRWHAQAKQYSYFVWASPEPVPFEWRRYAAVVPAMTNWSTVKQAARLFVGSHDFLAFRLARSSAQTTSRTIFLSQWEMVPSNHLWHYRVVGNGFLYRMVRLMVGAMIQAGQTGDLSAIREALAVPERNKIRKAAPAHGLMLDWIRYSDVES